MQELMNAISNGKGSAIGIMGILGIVMIVAISNGYHVNDRDETKPILVPPKDMRKMPEIVEDEVVG